LRLKLAVKAYGAKNWSKIQGHIKGRTDVKCRERWVNVLNPSLTRSKWTPEEDEKLLELAKSMGLGEWTKIAKFLPPRTDNQCWRRWKKLTEKETLEKYRQEIAIKRMSRSARGKKRREAEEADDQTPEGCNNLFFSSSSSTSLILSSSTPSSLSVPPAIPIPSSSSSLDGFYPFQDQAQLLQCLNQNFNFSNNFAQHFLNSTNNNSFIDFSSTINLGPGRSNSFQQSLSASSELPTLPFISNFTDNVQLSELHT